MRCVAGPGLQPIFGRPGEAGLFRERRAPGSLHAHVNAAVRGRASAGTPCHFLCFPAPQPCLAGFAQCHIGPPERLKLVAMQDVGLLFCSNMAASIAAIGLAAGASTPEIMGTALTWLAISTVFVGICTMLVGRYKLATLVQYMPLPVVGACAAHTHGVITSKPMSKPLLTYLLCTTDLAYVGFFCIAAGVELGTGVNLADIKAWPGFAHEAVLLKLVPTIAATMALLLTMRSVVLDIPRSVHAVTHMLALMFVLLCLCFVMTHALTNVVSRRYVHNSLALPMVLCLIPVSFHVVRVALGSSMADATASGWLMPGQVLISLLRYII